MRILGTIVMGMFFIVGDVAFAAQVNLNDGRLVQGDIIKQDNKSIQISVDGVAMTYYADEIKDVDGKPFGSAKVTSVPVVTPVAAKIAVQPEVAVPSAPPVIPVPAAGGIDQDKKALILKFIDVFGTRQALTTNFGIMIKQIEKEKPEEAEKIRQRVKVDEIIERLLPIYDRNFTADDLKAFISFYGSAEGQKLLVTIPVLMKESVGESVKYMEEKFPEAKQKQ